jgi:diketogulonate reductase-like aldo/keto reductase
MYAPTEGHLNQKGGEEASIDLCLKLLGVDYVDLLLVHNPVISDIEYKAAFSPHMFELFNHWKHPKAILPTITADGDELRPIVIKGRLEAMKSGPDAEFCKESRKKVWAAMEKALKAGKCKYIGVSNYPTELLKEMTEYAEIMPAVN